MPHGRVPGFPGRCAAALLCCAVFAAPLPAQTVRGTLVASGSGDRVNSGIVALLDATGRVVAATMSDDSGSYTVQAPSPGTYSVRIERVGFRSTVTPPFTLANGEFRELSLTVSSDAVVLNAVRVVADKRCVVRPQQGLAAAEMWNEARKVLDATRIARQQRQFAMRIRRFERDLEPATLEARTSEQFDLEGESGSPFVSVSADTLRRFGFRRQHADGTWTYYAPDADVLLSDTFLDSHCLMALPLARGLVGLMFEPVPGRRLPDVKGVLWFDPRSAELRFLQYQYVNLGLDVPTDRTGGRIDFSRLPNGRWIVRRWHIRMPVVRMERAGLGIPGARIEQREVLFAIKEVGGEVLEVLPPGARRSLAASLSGVAHDSLRGTPLAGAKVFVSGTGHAAVTDSQGRYRIDSIAPGTYSVSFMLPRLDSLPTDVPATRVSVSAGAASTADLALPSHASIARARCGDQPRSDSLPLVFGYVRDADFRRPVAAADVRASWQEIRGAGSEQLTSVERSAETKTDASGRYILCAVPLDVPLALRARRATHAGPVAKLRALRLEPLRVDITVPAEP